MTMHPPLVSSIGDILSCNSYARVSIKAMDVIPLRCDLSSPFFPLNFQNLIDQLSQLY